MDRRKRRLNEKKFGSWKGFKGGGRLYYYEVTGRHGWKARYVKEVDADEKTLKFYQEIYNEQGELEEIHQKYPVDTKHKKIERGMKK